MKIIKLSAQNILRLNAIEITPDGNLIVIGGDNEQGKTSVLDSIMLAMGGRQAKHPQPLKKGAKKGKIIVELDGLTVTRTLTSKGGGTLKVEGQEGSPQRILDNLTGQLTFDPLAWSGMDGPKQKKILTEMLGLDFTELDAERKAIFDKRTENNREAKRLEGELSGLELHDNVPNKEVSVSMLMEELEGIQKQNKKSESLSAEIERIKVQYNKLIRDAEELKITGKKLQAELKGLPDVIDEKELQNQITNAGVVNNQIRENQNHWAVSENLKKTKKIADAFTNQINSIDIKKEESLSSAKFPIKELSFDEDGVLYKGIPFSQCSSAESLRVSVAMGIAMNPELKVLLIRDGSLLDNKNLAMVAKMAEESGCQIWLERVGKGEECSVIIEDGRVEGQVIEEIKPKEVKEKDDSEDW